MIRKDRALIQQSMLLLTLLLGLAFLPRAYANDPDSEDLQQQRQAYGKALQMAH